MIAMLAWLPDAGVPRLLVDVLWQGALVGALVWAVLRAWQPRACLRAAALWWGLVALVVAPAATWAVRWQGGGLLVSADDSQTAAVLAESRTGIAPALDRVAPELSGSGAPLPVAMRLDREPAATGASTTSSSTPADVFPPRFGEASPSSLARGLTVAWALWSLVYLIRLTRSARRTSRLWRSATPWENDELAADLDRTAERLGLRRVPAVRQSAAIISPAVIGWGSPRLLWPAAGVPAEQRQAVLWHELAHLARGDGWGLLMAELVVAAIPFQPLAAILKRHYRQACEEACDDWVLAGGVAPLELAELLTHWLPGSAAPLSLAMAESPAAARARILRLLSLSEPPNPRVSRLSRHGLLALVLGAVATLSLLQVRSADSQPAQLSDVSESDVTQPQRAPTTPQPSDDDRSSPVPPPTESARAVTAPASLAKPAPFTLGPGDLVRWRIVSLMHTPERPLEPGDALRIRVLNTLPELPVDDVYPIDTYGQVNFSAPYGQVHVVGETIDAATGVIRGLFGKVLREPEVSVALELDPLSLTADAVLDAQGRLALDRFGRFQLAGLTVDEAEREIVTTLANRGSRAEIQLDLVESPRNAVFLIVHFDQPGTPDAAPYDRGTEVHRIPLGHPDAPRTVLDVIASQRLRLGPKAQLRLRRSDQDGRVSEHLVDLADLLAGRSPISNYALAAGDQIHVEGAWDREPTTTRASDNP